MFTAAGGDPQTMPKACNLKNITAQVRWIQISLAGSRTGTLVVRLEVAGMPWTGSRT